MDVIKPQNGMRGSTDANGEKNVAKWSFALPEARLMEMLIDGDGCCRLTAAKKMLNSFLRIPGRILHQNSQGELPAQPGSPRQLSAYLRSGTGPNRATAAPLPNLA